MTLNSQNIFSWNIYIFYKKEEHGENTEFNQIIKRLMKNLTTTLVTCAVEQRLLFIQIRENNDVRVWMEALSCLRAKWKYIKMSSEKQRNTKCNQAVK